MYIKQDDLRPGIHVAVHSYNLADNPFSCEEGPRVPIAPLPIIGHAFRVVAIHRPFIALAPLPSHPGEYKDGESLLTTDISRLNLVQLSPGYVRRLKSHFSKSGVKSNIQQYLNGGLQVG